MAKLKLQANPSFVCKVLIPVAGGEPEELVFTFKHRTKSGMDEFIKSRTDKSDTESIMDMATAWDLDDAFSADNLEALCQNYIAAPLEIYRAYIDELTKARIKN
jgi:hypothetical protein